jgi:hypothetical protein
MNVYTDPRLLDVSGAMESLPALSMSGSTAGESQTLFATGTDLEASAQLPPMLPPKTGLQGVTLSVSGNSDKLERSTSETSCEGESSPESAENPTKKASSPVSGNEAFERPRRDLNPQPPDRQSGALTN